MPSKTRRESRPVFVARVDGTLSQRESLLTYVCKDGVMRRLGKKPKIKGRMGVTNKRDTSGSSPCR